MKHMTKGYVQKQILTQPELMSLLTFKLNKRYTNEQLSGISGHPVDYFSNIFTGKTPFDITGLVNLFQSIAGLREWTARIAPSVFTEVKELSDTFDARILFITGQLQLKHCRTKNNASMIASFQSAALRYWFIVNKIDYQTTAKDMDLSLSAVYKLTNGTTVLNEDHLVRLNNAVGVESYKIIPSNKELKKARHIMKTYQRASIALVAHLLEQSQK